MVESFINKITASLYGSIGMDDLELVIQTVRAELIHYDLAPSSTDIVPYTGILPECYKAFMVTKRLEGKSEKTLSLYKMYIEDMLITLHLPVREITANMIKVYLFQLQQDRGISNRTLDSRRAALSSFFSWCAAEDYIDKNPMAALKPIKYERTERVPLTDTQMELIRQSCVGIREQAIVEVLYSTGCRVTELERLNRADVNFATGEVLLFGKGNKHRKSFLTAKAALLLGQYLSSRCDSDDALFVGEKSPHARLKKSAIEKIIKTIGKKAGIGELHPHLIRHTTATNALRRGMDVTQVKELLGHESLDTTTIYVKVDHDTIKLNHRKCLA